MSKRLEDAFYEGLKPGRAKVAAPALPTGASLDTSGAFAQPRPVNPGNIFENPHTHPVVLDMVLLKRFQLNWLPWDGDVLFRSIEQEFKMSVAEVNRLKIMAAQNLHVIDAFWEQWEVFEKVIAGLNGIIPQFNVMQPPDLATLYAGIDIANGIRQETYSDEVKRYCAAVLLNEGVTYAAPPLDFCQEYVSQPMYRCKDCDQTGSALPPFDGHCPSCTQKFEQDKAFSLKPDPDMKDKTRGANLEYNLAYDSQATKKRYEELSKMPAEQLSSSLRDVAEDIESARLIVAVDYMQHQERQLKEQLESLRGWLEAS